MRRFWNDIQRHPAASGAFLLYWAAAYLLHIARWHAPRETADIAPPVLLLHALLPAVAGALAAWWRGPRAGRIRRGMLAGAVITFTDFALIFAHDIIKFWPPQGGSGEGVLELPAFLAVFTAAGALLGTVGAVVGAAVGGEAPESERAPAVPPPRRKLAAVASLAFAAALLIFAVVIPPVSRDTSPHATPARAVPAFAIIAVLSLWVGAGSLVASSAKTGRASRPIAAGAGLLALPLGAILLAASEAALGGQAIRLAGVACLAAALCDIIAGVIALAAARGRREIEE